MILSAADQTAMLAAIGEAVTVNGVSVTADFRLESAPVQIFDGSVMSSNPMARISSADFSARSVDYGSNVIARSVTYTVAEIRQEQSGFYLLILTK